MLNKRTIGLIRYFLKMYPRRSAMIIALTFLSGFAEGFGVLSILPLLELAVGDPENRSNLMLAMEGALARIGLEPTLGVLLLFIILGMFLKGAFMWLVVRQQGFAVAAIATDLRLMLIRGFLRARWAYFITQRTGHISNAMGHEAQIASGAYAASCAMVAACVQVLVYLVLAFLISPFVALAGIVAGVMLVLVLKGLVQKGREAGDQQTRVIKSLSARLIDALYGIKPIKAMGRETHLQPLLEGETRELNEIQRRTVLAMGTLGAMQEPLLVVVLAGGLYLLLTFTAVPFATLLVMTFVFHRLVGNIHGLQGTYQSLAWSEATFWSLRAGIERAEAEVDRVTGSTAPPPLRDGIELVDVSFGYTEAPVLRKVSLRIPAGAFVAVIGPSGGGKTTLADLIIGLYEPWSGDIRIDGVSLREIDLYAWRRRIGYVPQDLLLFHDSIRRNVTLDDPALGDDDVYEALRAAGAWEFVASLPKGIDTVIGERGSQLSGGQRQRISIARALVGKPALLVLDEATTALDPATEAAICETLARLRGDITIVSISHQPAMKEAADVVYQLEHGTITELVKPAGELVRVASA